MKVSGGLVRFGSGHNQLKVFKSHGVPSLDRCTERYMVGVVVGAAAEDVEVGA